MLEMLYVEKREYVDNWTDIQKGEDKRKIYENNLINDLEAV